MYRRYKNAIATVRHSHATHGIAYSQNRFNIACVELLLVETQLDSRQARLSARAEDRDWKRGHVRA